MSAHARQCSDAISAAIYDLENARMVLRGVIRGKTPAKNPRKAILEYIGSANDALKEALTPALKLPLDGKKVGGP